MQKHVSTSCREKLPRRAEPPTGQGAAFARRPGHHVALVSGELHESPLEEMQDARSEERCLNITLPVWCLHLGSNLLLCGRAWPIERATFS